MPMPLLESLRLVPRLFRDRFLRKSQAMRAPINKPPIAAPTAAPANLAVPEPLDDFEADPATSLDDDDDDAAAEVALEDEDPASELFVWVVTCAVVGSTVPKLVVTTMLEPEVLVITDVEELRSVGLATTDALDDGNAVSCAVWLNVCGPS